MKNNTRPGACSIFAFGTVYRLACVATGAIEQHKLPMLPPTDSPAPLAHARFMPAVRRHAFPMGAPGPSPEPAALNWPDLYYSLSDAEGPAEVGTKTSGWFGRGWDSITQETTDSNCAAGVKDTNFCGASGDANTYTWSKSGGIAGSTTQILITNDGYTVTALFNASLGSVDAIQLAKDVRNAISAVGPPAGMDLFPQYSSSYTDWQDSSTFAATLATAKGNDQSPSRVDGMMSACVVDPLTGHCTPSLLFRARLGPNPTFGPSTWQVNQTCGSMITTLQAGTSGQLVSLQKFYDGSVWRYQAVFSQPAL